MIGLGSYAFFWRHRDGMTLEGALRETAELGLGLFQVCDQPAIEDADLASVRSLAADLGIRLELGTRGTDPRTCAATSQSPMPLARPCCARW